MNSEDDKYFSILFKTFFVSFVTWEFKLRQHLALRFITVQQCCVGSPADVSQAVVCLVWCWLQIVTGAGATAGQCAHWCGYSTSGEVQVCSQPCLVSMWHRAAWLLLSHQLQVLRRILGIQKQCATDKY